MGGETIWNKEEQEQRRALSKWGGRVGGRGMWVHGVMLVDTVELITGIYMRALTIFGPDCNHCEP